MTLVIRTLQGEKVGVIGNGHKAGSLHLFKQRAWDFDIMDAHDEPRFRVRRLPGQLDTTAEVYERGDATDDANWRKMGQIATKETYSMSLRHLAHALYEVQENGLCDKPFARVGNHPRQRAFRYWHNKQAVAHLQEIVLPYVDRS